MIAWVLLGLVLALWVAIVAYTAVRNRRGRS